MEINSAPNGKPKLLVKKSAKSKKFFPKIFISENIPNDNALGTPTKNICKPYIQAARLRLSNVFLIPIETIVSNIAMEEVSVANNNKIKNKSMKKAPNGSS